MSSVTGRRIFVTAPELSLWPNISSTDILNTTLRTLLLPLDAAGDPLYRTLVGVELNSSVAVKPQQPVVVDVAYTTIKVNFSIEVFVRGRCMCLTMPLHVFDHAPVHV